MSRMPKTFHQSSTHGVINSYTYILSCGVARGKYIWDLISNDPASVVIWQRTAARRSWCKSNRLVHKQLNWLTDDVCVAFVQRTTLILILQVSKARDVPLSRDVSTSVIGPAPNTYVAPLVCYNIDTIAESGTIKWSAILTDKGCIRTLPPRQSSWPRVGVHFEWCACRQMCEVIHWTRCRCHMTYLANPTNRIPRRSASQCTTDPRLWLMCLSQCYPWYPVPRYRSTSSIHNSSRTDSVRCARQWKSRSLH